MAATNLDTLGLDVQLHIFGYLDPIESTCLGLASKKLYAVHVQLHGNVGLDKTSWSKVHHREVRVHHMLRTWMWSSAKLVYGGVFNLGFITEERFRIEATKLEAQKKDLDVKTERIGRILFNSLEEQRVEKRYRWSIPKGELELIYPSMLGNAERDQRYRNAMKSQDYHFGIMEDIEAREDIERDDNIFLARIGQFVME